MPAVAPMVTGRIAEDATGAVFEYTPPTLTPVSGGQQPITRLFGTYSAPGTIVIPAGFAIYDACMLETGGGSSSGFSLGTTVNAYDIFYTTVNSHGFTKQSTAGSISKQFFSTTSPTTIYVGNSGIAWPSNFIVKSGAHAHSNGISP